MKFHVKHRDGPARIGELLINDKKIISPNILFVNTKRFKAPNFADFLITNNNLKITKTTLQISDEFFYPMDLSKDLHISTIKLNKKMKKDYFILPCNIEVIDDALKNNPASLIIVTNAIQLFKQPKRFIDFIVTLREKIGYQKMIYLPAVGEPNNYSILSYLGIDFFDSLSAIIAARNNILFFQTGNYHINKIDEIPCNCPSCNNFKGTPSEMDFETILKHNYYIMLNEIKHVRNSIKHGSLRNLVETRIINSPELTSVLRNLDKNHFMFLEKRTPISSKSKLIATSKESLYRPEIKRFQSRVINRYRKPKSSKVLLLLPCSAKKPYSYSKSHRLFKDQLFSSGNPFVIHEMIITSPLGLVPRELELIYPASNYDIPVTGIWDEDEKKMIHDLLKKYLNINKYDKIIVHLPRDIIDFIQDVLEKQIITCVDHPTSKESLINLSKILKESIVPYEKIKSQRKNEEIFESFTSYQFGKKIAIELLKNCIVKGKYPYQKIIHDGTQLGMITSERGFISLTIQGAERLVKSKKYWVEIYSDFKLVGSVFAPGVKKSDENIRIGDEVIVLQNGKLQGVGVALMSGEEMQESSYGEAVKIRHLV